MGPALMHLGLVVNSVISQVTSFLLLAMLLDMPNYTSMIHRISQLTEKEEIAI